MTTWFSKQKLVEAQEKKAMGGSVSGLLSKKKMGDASRKDYVVIPPPTHSPTKSPTSPTSSLKVVASSGKEAHEVLFVEDLSPLMAKLSNEVMSSHIQKLVQNLEKKVATSEPMIKSLSAENEMIKNKVAILTDDAENDKERVAVLEKCLQVEKDFCKLKDKQIGDLELKYYVEGFELLRKWMVKHHPDLYLSGLVMEEVEKSSWLIFPPRLQQRM
nr:hypothetical protein CFP56_19036 [Quercus suber]